MARAPFTFVVPDGAQPGEVTQVQVLGILARVELPAGTFGGQQLTGTYSRAVSYTHLTLPTKA